MGNVSAAERPDPGKSAHTGGADKLPQLPLPFGEFITLMALLMAMTAMSIDIMLPALPEIGEAFGVTAANDRQLVVGTYLLGFAVGQLFWGPVSDRFGRKAPLLAGLLIFAAGALAATLAGGFSQLLAARALQGFGGGAARSIATAIIRDLFVGRAMARVMSTVMMVFISVPILAPSVGQAVIRLGGWPATFYVLLLAAVVAATWSAFRLPETRSGQATAFSLPKAVLLVVGSSATRAYGAAAGLTFGCLVTYISSAQQVFGEVYGLGSLFPLAFGGIACAIALASFTNARLVQRLGMRRLSHTALVAFIAASLILSVTAALTRPPLWFVLTMLSVLFYLFGLMQSNFNAIAMQPVGQAAGTASSLLGAFTTAVGATLGVLIARQFNGTILPLATGFLVLSTCALVCVLAVEGRSGMFRGE